MPLEAGRRLGPHEIVARRGRGGMGEVYRARDTRLERTVAVKVLPAKRAQDGEVRRRFEREARAISSLSHPHICALYDVGAASLGVGSSSRTPSGRSCLSCPWAARAGPVPTVRERPIR